MDDYPKHLAPEFNELGVVIEPFRDWWDRVSSHFPTAPENVAQYWLYEHWGRSPYSYLKATDYGFQLIVWPSEALWEIRSCWCDFDPQNVGCFEKGRELVETTTYSTVTFMLQSGDFPQPILVLDNRDGHNKCMKNNSDWQDLPASYVLIEGHTRFNIALYLQKTHRLAPTVGVWVLERTEKRQAK